jgi:hypothetical protein
MNNPFKLFALANSPTIDLNSPESVELLPEGCVCVISRNCYGAFILKCICESWVDARDLCELNGRRYVTLQRSGAILYTNINDWQAHAGGLNTVWKVFIKTGLVDRPWVLAKP